MPASAVVTTRAPMPKPEGGGCELLTVTVAAALAEPDAPVQLTEYAVVTVGATLVVPEIAPAVSKPPPVHESAFVEPQVSAEDWPAVIEVGLADRDAVTV